MRFKLFMTLLFLKGHRETSYGQLDVLPASLDNPIAMHEVRTQHATHRGTTYRGFPAFDRLTQGDQYRGELPSAAVVARPSHTLDLCLTNS